MYVDLKPATRPHTIRRARPHVINGTSRRRQEHGGNVVRVSLSAFNPRLYAYRCTSRAQLGDMVRVDTPVQGEMVVAVVALGRGDYMGPLKACEVVR